MFTLKIVHVSLLCMRVYYSNCNCSCFVGQLRDDLFVDMKAEDMKMLLLAKPINYCATIPQSTNQIMCPHVPSTHCKYFVIITCCFVYLDDYLANKNRNIQFDK